MLALHATKNARKLLEAGFTAVRDLGGFTQWENTVIVDLKKAIQLGLVPGPRIVVAGWMAPTGGHGAPVLGMSSSWLIKGWTPDSSTPASNGIWQIRERVRQLNLLGLDQIKTVASGGLGKGGAAAYTYEELKALVDEAPSPIKEGIGKEEAEELKTKLEEAGATVELK